MPQIIRRRRRIDLETVYLMPGEMQLCIVGSVFERVSFRVVADELGVGEHELCAHTNSILYVLPVYVGSEDTADSK